MSIGDLISGYEFQCNIFCDSETSDRNFVCVGFRTEVSYLSLFPLSRNHVEKLSFVPIHVNAHYRGERQANLQKILFPTCTIWLLFHQCYVLSFTTQL